MRPTRLALALALVSVAACKKTEPVPIPLPPVVDAATPIVAPTSAAAAEDGGSIRAQVPIGGDGSLPPQLPFKITKVRTTGDWIYFDAETKGGARFTFGWENKKAASNRFSFGKARLEVPDRAAGTTLVDELAKALHRKTPPAGEARKGPFEFGIAILADKVAKEPGGGYGGKGTYTATKIFPEMGERQGEIFFNFSLEEKAGELSEKEAEYDDDVLKIFAAALRDGGK